MGEPLDAEWLLTFADGAVAVETGHAKGDAAVRGPAADLLLALWRRRPLGTVDVVGDRAVVEQLVDLVRI
jgi:predicted lipid carrier protein YhbT